LQARINPQRRFQFCAGGIGVIGDVLADPLCQLFSQLRLASTVARTRLERAAFTQMLFDPACAGAADAEQLGDLLGGLVLRVELDDPFANEQRVCLHAVASMTAVKATKTPGLALQKKLPRSR